MAYEKCSKNSWLPKDFVSFPEKINRAELRLTNPKTGENLVLVDKERNGFPDYALTQTSSVVAFSREYLKPNDCRKLFADMRYQLFNEYFQFSKRSSSPNEYIDYEASRKGYVFANDEKETVKNFNIVIRISLYPEDVNSNEYPIVRIITIQGKNRDGKINLKIKHEFYLQSGSETVVEVVNDANPFIQRTFAEFDQWAADIISKYTPNFNK